MTLKQYCHFEPWVAFGTSKESFEMVIVYSSDESLRHFRKNYNLKLREKTQGNCLQFASDYYDYMR